MPAVTPVQKTYYRGRTGFPVAFKYSIFGFEETGLAKELRIVEQIKDLFFKLPYGKETLLQIAGSMDEAAKLIDQYKARSCGSAYNLALVNLNRYPSEGELSFLLGAAVLGDPRTVFLNTLRNTQGATYTWAREKVEREAEWIAMGRMSGAPSCIDAYSSVNRMETAERAAQILNAHLEEDEMRSNARRTGKPLPVLSPTSEIMKKSKTVVWGRRSTNKSGLFTSPSQQDPPQ